MKHGITQTDQTTRRILLIVWVAALAVASTVSPPQPVYADDIVLPPVPPELQVPPGNKAFSEGHAVGTQNYICLPSDSGFAWTFFGPQATLFNDDDKQIITHFLSLNPDERGMARATWQHSRDTSTVWAMPIASSSDPKFVEPDAIPWLLLQVVGTEPGPTGGERLTRTTFIQRLNTSGGVAPMTACPVVGQTLFVPYMADYFFYKAVKSE
jgi:photosystem II stability/assembly factor-like uncharacterized protein